LRLIYKQGDFLAKGKIMKYKNPFVDESAFEGDEGPKKSEDEVLMEEAKQHTEVQVVKTHMVSGMLIGVVAGALVSVEGASVPSGAFVPGVGSSVEGTVVVTWGSFWGFFVRLAAAVIPTTTAMATRSRTIAT
jgi:hypothetical protein